MEKTEMDITVLRIRNWDRHFENNRTRELKRMEWVPVPNKLDGDGYTELLDHENGPSHYGAWIALVLVASRCDPRGTLVRDGCDGEKIAHDEVSLSRISRVPRALFSDVVPRLISIGWLEKVIVTQQELTQIPQDDAGIPHGGASRARAQNGTERNGTERKCKRSPVYLSPPSVEEIRGYCRVRKNHVDPEKFHSHYSANGWVQGKQGKPLVDWQAAVRTWEGNNFGCDHSPPTQPPIPEIQ